jgi:hypothetical protein
VKVAQLPTGSTWRHWATRREHRPQTEQRGHQVRGVLPEATAEAQGFAKLGLDVGPLTSPRRFIGADPIHAHGLKGAGWDS